MFLSFHLNGQDIKQILNEWQYILLEKKQRSIFTNSASHLPPQLKNNPS